MPVSKRRASKTSLFGMFNFSQIAAAMLCFYEFHSTLLSCYRLITYMENLLMIQHVLISCVRFVVLAFGFPGNHETNWGISVNRRFLLLGD